MSKAELADSDTDQTTLFVAAGFDQDFVRRALATPNNDVWTPSSDELLRAHVVTAVANGSEFAASGYGAEVTRDEMAEKLIKVLPVLGTMKERLAIFQDEKPPPAKYGDYCDASVAMFREIIGLEQKEAALLLRQIWSEK